jgi:hypothetical protein
MFVNLGHAFVPAMDYISKVHVIMKFEKISILKATYTCVTEASGFSSVTGSANLESSVIFSAIWGLLEHCF